MQILLILSTSTSHLFSASISTRPVELVGAVILNSADSVGAISAGDAASRYLPGFTPAPMMIVGTCVSYEYGEPCVAVIVSAIYLYGSATITTSPLREG